MFRRRYTSDGTASLTEFKADPKGHPPTRLRRVRKSPHPYSLLSLGVLIFLCQESVFAQSIATDIRAHSHQGIRKMIALDVLRASGIVSTQPTLTVGSRFFACSPRAQARLALHAYQWLKVSNPSISGIVLIDGRSGTAFARYSPDHGLTRI